MDFDRTWDSVREKGLVESLSRPQLVGIGILALATLLVAAAIWFASCSKSELLVSTADSETSATAADAASSASSVSDPSASSGSRAAASGTIAVHVAGEVVAPGLYELPAGARVNDAVVAAGGFSEAADQTSVNLARALADGEQVRVPAKGEQAGSGGAATTGESAGPSGSASGGLINLNTATADQLQTINGIGPALAKRIVDSRTSEGSFASVDDLARVSGIGSKKLEAIRPYVTVG